MRKQYFLPGMIAVFSCWVLGLVCLAIFSTDVVVLNRRQIERSSLVCTGSLKEVNSGRILIQTVWKGNVDQPEIVVDPLPPGVNRPGDRWIFALVEKAGEKGTFSIAPYAIDSGRQDPNRPRGLLVYPASPQTENQLKSLLEDAPE